MKFLGIDYGRRKIGLAVGDSEYKFTEPLSVIRYVDQETAIKKIDELAKVERIDKIIIGVSEGKMAAETKEFSHRLQKVINLPVAYQDETLTSKDAQKFSIEAGIKRKKRREKEDSYSAAIILQSYLEDSNP